MYRKQEASTKKNGVQKEINLQSEAREVRKGAFNRFTVNSQ